MNRLHTLILFLVLFQRGPGPSRPRTLFLGFVGGLSPLPVPVPGGAGARPLHLLCLGGPAADLHSLAGGLSSLCTARLGSGGFCADPLGSTTGSSGPAAGRRDRLLIACFA
ncbi:hypothetical protein XENOCAPTIV_030442 [Xenoophorus captivus]|uniref:Secreted protein n=1 Tax=Xenoophorus captivus TaxID=1517983 RepID=A0ABV0RW42_9TELE